MWPANLQGFQLHHDIATLAPQRYLSSMRAMVMETARQPLRMVDVPIPLPGAHQVLMRVLACGVCRTDLHIADGELPKPHLPLVLGHQIVGEVAGAADASERFRIGDRIGVPWLGGSCGCCAYCSTGRENLCDSAQYTGYQINGGFAEFAVADERFCFPIPTGFSPLQAAPLLCAGLIGYRAYRMCDEARRVGLYGFGAAAHILIQVARFEGRSVYAFTRAGDRASQTLAKKLGAAWVGGSEELPPESLDAAIIFAPVGELVPPALRAVAKGGVVVCAGIHMSDIPSFPYELLWGERILRSVANLTRRDGEEFLQFAPRVPIHTEVQVYPLEQAGRALDDLRAGRIAGAAVVQVAES